MADRGTLKRSINQHMKSGKNDGKTHQLTNDSQNRLLAYTTAAGLGAFFAEQNVEAQVTASAALAPYPQTLAIGSGLGASLTYFYIDVDGNGTNDLLLDVNTFRVTISKALNTQTNNLPLNPSTDGYVIPWTNGMTLNATSGSAPTYKQFLATSLFYNGGWEFYFDKFPTVDALGFSFADSNGQVHFGYMNIQVNHTTGDNNDFTATVTGIYYNATPNAAIVIGALPPVPTVQVTSIKVGAGNAVTINFTSSDNAAATAFSLKTSPTLGASASWATDSGAVITSSAPGVYQAVTTGLGGSSQFYRISH
jgi:hypothetical protein